MARYRRYSSDEDESIDIHVRRGRSPHPPPPNTSTVITQPVRALVREPVTVPIRERELRIRDRPQDQHREENRPERENSPYGRVKREELEMTRRGTPSRRANISHHREQNAEIIRLERRIRELTEKESRERRLREMLYKISTVTRDESREYRPIDLRLRQNEGDILNEVHHDAFSAHRGRDLDFQFELPIHIDYSNEVDILSRLRRQGNFAEATDLFNRQLQDHLHHPFIFVQYAELLFDMADYNSLVALDPRPAFGAGFNYRQPSIQLRQWPSERRANRVVYRSIYHAYPSSKEDDDTSPPDLHNLGFNEVRLLYLNWKLLKSLSTFHTKGTMDEALADAKDAVHFVVVHDEIGSTEIRVMCLALRAFSYVRHGVPDLFHMEVRDLCIAWADWPRVYQGLLNDDQIWDFRDLFTATITCLGTDAACQMFFPDESKSYRNKLLDNWIEDEEEESTSLAQLDMLVTMMLHGPVPNWHRTVAHSLIEQISKKQPQAMGARPVMQWMLADAFHSSFSNDHDGRSRDMFAYLDYCPGLVLTRHNLFTLPIYVPFEFEVPGWVVPEPSKEAREVVEMTLVRATEIQDYATQVLCLHMLILHTPQDPSELFLQLGQLQKSVLGDTDGYLRTLLSSYLACKSKDAETKLLAELRQLENWAELNSLRDADLHLAKQQMERVLAAKVNGNQCSLLASASRFSMIFYPWLSDEALSFVNKLKETGSRRVEVEKDDGSLVVAGPGISRSPSPRPIIRHVERRQAPGQDSGDRSRRELEYDSDGRPLIVPIDRASGTSSNDGSYEDYGNSSMVLEIPRSLARGKKVKLIIESDEEQRPGTTNAIRTHKTKVQRITRGTSKGKKVSVSRGGAGPPRRMSTRPPAGVQTENESSGIDEVQVYSTSPRALSPPHVENKRLALIPARSRPDDYLYYDNTIRVYPW